MEYKNSEAYILPEQPGVVRFTHDVMTGILCGSMAKEVVKRWNNHQAQTEVVWPEKYKTIKDGDLQEGDISHEEEMRRRYQNEAIDACQAALSQAKVSRGVDVGDINELIEYFDQRADADDGRPNEEMKMLTIVQALADRQGKLRKDGV